MFPIAPHLIGAFAVTSILIFVWGYHLKTADQRVAGGAVPARKKKSGANQQSGPIAELADAVGRPFVPVVLRSMGSAGQAKIRRRIESAGRPGGMTLEMYARQKAGNILVFGGAGILIILIGQMFLGILLIAAGWFQTDMTLYSKSQKRQDEIQRTLPDFLDVLSVTVSAGLSFKQALDRVAESVPGALSEEMRTALRQMDLGTPRREAFEDLRQRNSCESLSTFVTAILQAEELGAPLAQALQEIAIDMRRDFAQYAKRKAQRAEPRITAVTTFLMLPGLLALIIGGIVYGSPGSFDVFG